MNVELLQFYYSDGRGGGEGSMSVMEIFQQLRKAFQAEEQVRKLPDYSRVADHPGLLHRATNRGSEFMTFMNSPCTS